MQNYGSKRQVICLKSAQINSGKAQGRATVVIVLKKKKKKKKKGKIKRKKEQMIDNRYEIQSGEIWLFLK